MANRFVEVPNPAHRPERTELTPEQLRYIQLKFTTKLSQREIADQLGVHYNTISNWNKSPLVNRAMDAQLEALKRDNQMGAQKLMSSLIREAGNILDDPNMGNTIKVQLIGQLFSQAGKFAGLEPVKQVNKEVKIKKSFEQLIDVDSEVIDIDVE